jgi:hypothetical protein
MSTTTDLQEPQAHDRVYYRNRDTGELAYLVRFGDKTKLRLNRPNELVIVRLDLNRWFEDDHKGYDLQPMQRALVALEADKALCRLLGLPVLAKRDWARLRDTERIAWLENGPDSIGDPARDRARYALWKAVMGVMARLI